jgi:Mrp family chromosome partitioning ATPase
MFDYIIIDAPPLGIFTDANVLMTKADGALLVVRAGKTRYNLVDKLLEQIPKDRMMGIVLNRAEEQPDSTSYYYQHRYYNRDRRVKTAATPPLPADQKKEEVVVVN